MRLDNVSGYFDCREFDSRKAYADCQMKADTQQIAFNLTFAPDQLPEVVSEFAKESKHKDGTRYFKVRMKIGRKCEFLRKEKGFVRRIKRPTNEELDGKRWNVCLDFNALHGDSDKKEARGYWLNGILLQGTQSDLFADLNEEVAEENSVHLPNEVAGEMADEDLEF